MMIYIVMLAFVLVCVSFQGRYHDNFVYKEESNNHIINYKIPLVYITSFMFFSALLLLSIMRAPEVGTDGIMYYKFFWYGNFEVYFDPLINFIYTYSIQNNEYSYFIYITSFLFVSVSFYTILRLDFPKWVLIFYFISSYYYLISFNVVRQSIAISIVFLAVSVIYNSKKLNLKMITLFIVLIVVASGFHNSAILTLSFLVFRFLKLNHFILLSGFMLITIGYFSSFIKSIIQPIFRYFEFYTLKYGAGSSFFIMEEGSKGFTEFLPIFVQYIFLYIGYTLYINKQKDVAGTYILNYYFIFLILYAFSGIEAIDRFQYYFYPSIILFYAWIFKRSYSSGKYTYFNYFTIVFWVLYYLLRLIGNKHGVVPYLI